MCKRKDCLYSPPRKHKNGCDYMYLTGEARGCDIKNCTRYVKATQKEQDKFLAKMLELTVHSFTCTLTQELNMIEVKL